MNTFTRGWVAKDPNSLFQIGWLESAMTKTRGLIANIGKMMG